ncbi:MAG: hypothetical protein IT340_07050 [Chloroflexi bacterium]|nr:hypothetical protein [Chloroflexota bacterium]
MTELEAVSRWLGVVLALGWLGAPIVGRLLPALPMGAFFLARPFAVLLVGYAAWLTASLRLLAFETALWAVGLPLLAALAGLVVALALRRGRSVRALLPARATVLAMASHEALFIAVFAGFAWLRGYTPDITFTEKPMELMLLNSALHAQTMPPPDGWLAGHTVNYYYLGYVLAAALTHLAGVGVGYAFNLMLTTIVALAAVMAFGLAASLWACCRDDRQPRLDMAAGAVGLLAAYLLVAAGNLVGGWRWLGDPAGTAAAPWWGGIGWASSRVIVDHMAGGGERPTINEFPWFSFILGDLHPHVLALPFGLLALGVVVDWWRWSPAPDLVKRDWLAIARLTAGALAVGALYAINSWDFPLYLMLAAVALTRPAWWSLVRPHQVASAPPIAAVEPPVAATDLPAAEADPAPAPLRGRPVWIALAALVGASVLLLLPFYLSFTSFAGNASVRALGGLDRVPLVGSLARMIGVVTWERTNLGEYLQIWGFLNVAGVAWLLWLARRGLSITPNIVGLATIGVALVGILIGSAPLALGGATAALALIVWRFGRVNASEGLTCLLLTVAFGLVIGPEFVFLQDVFADRMNTVFKTYYQAWTVLSLLGALGVGATVTALAGVRRDGARGWERAVTIGTAGAVSVTLLLTLGYPLLATPARADRFAKRPGLDGLAYISAQPDEQRALAWMADNIAPGAIVVEDPGHSYGEHFGLPHARAATIVGTRTPVAWPGHETQWRANQPALLSEINARLRDIQELYGTTDVAVAGRILDHYDAEYVYVGLWERAAENRQRARQPVYSPAALAKFDQFMDVAYRQGQVTIYRRR